MNEYTAKDLSKLKPENALKVLKALPETDRQRLMKELVEQYSDFVADLMAQGMVENLNRNVLD